MALTINATSFKYPSAIKRSEDDYKRYSKQRAIDGTLNPDIMTFGKKTRLIFSWKVLTAAQLTQLKTWIETGTYNVTITDTDYAYNATSLIELDGGWKEGYGGAKEDITVRISQV